MSKYQLSNEELTATFDTHGAELISLKDNQNEKEYLWDADPAFWGRHAPVLFPFVGGLKNKQFIYRGISYPMGQHGFARDMEFRMVSKADKEIWFALCDNEETYQKYPFHFELKLGYELDTRKLTVKYEVINLGKETMYFQIGAHPAFVCPLKDQRSNINYIRMKRKEISAFYLDQVTGLRREMEETIVWDSIDEDYGYLKVTKTLFERDAIIIEQSKIHEVSLCNEEKEPYVTVVFDTDVFGLWSPAGKEAPFVCIEPWYGRCDPLSFAGELCEKDYINRLQEKEHFIRSYHVQV